jgi:TNF receptor-associated protein 1
VSLLIYRTGTYEIQEAEGVQPGTKIVLHLKQDNREFSDEDTVNGMSSRSLGHFEMPGFVVSYLT